MTDRLVTHATFTLERTYSLPPSRVFEAWADPEVKRRWFANDAPDYDLDFRAGGLEHSFGQHDGKRMAWESLYREIVPGERIVYTSVLAEGDEVMTVSLTSIEFTAEAEGTRLVLVEAGAYLDGRERPEWREDGTAGWLDTLGHNLQPH